MTARAVLAAALVLLLAACAPAPPDAPAPRHVLVVVLDATQAAQLGAFGGDGATSPRLDAFAARGARFRRAVSSATWTLPSTTSLLTGLLQEHHGVVTNHHALADDGPTTLAERFADAGWRTAAFVQMVYASDSYGLDRGFDTYRYYATDAEKREDGLAVLDVATWLREREAAGERSFTYAHFRRPHSPYDPDNASVAALGVDPTSVPRERLELLMHADSRVRGLDDLRDGELDLLRGMYRANIRSIDERLATLLDWASERDDTLVVITADHGEGLGEHGHFGHGDRLFPEHVGVPFVIVGPGVEARDVDARVTTVDVAATLADLCALDADPRDFDGRSLATTLRGGDDLEQRGVLASGRYRAPTSMPPVAHKGPRWTVVRHGDGAVSLFDTRADPQETRDIADEHPDVVAARLPELERLVDRGVRASVPGGAGPALDAARREQLEALGYVDDDR